MEQWKRQYEKCDAAFMGLARQPAWSDLDALMITLGHIRQSVQKNEAVAQDDIKALSAWVMGGKPAMVEGYLQALRAAYGYARSAMEEQGKDIDALCPELEGGQMARFLQAPMRAKALAWEILSDIRKQHPFVAAQLNHLSVQPQKKAA
jgi:hypothetical protein